MTYKNGGPGTDTPDAANTQLTSSNPTHRRYLDKACASCGASFAPTSGRARFCADCRAPKWATARNTASKQRQRAEDTIEDLTRPPRDLTVLGSHRRADRIGWVRDALTMARRLHRAHRIGLSQEVVKWARRTALGEVALVGPHHLGELVIHLEAASLFAAPLVEGADSKRGHDRDPVCAGQSVIRTGEMSESGTLGALW